MLGIPLTVLAAPLLLGIGIAVAIEARGAPIHRETRLGRDGRPLAVRKLRTLRHGTGAASLVAPPGDPRVTRLGGFLRRTHLDELPQLFQVLGGTMSLVGPRPAREEFWAGLPDELRRRGLAHRPGMTSPASLRYLCEDEVLARFADPESIYRRVIFPAKIAEDVRYFEHRTCGGDLGVLAATGRALASRRRRRACRERLDALLASTADDVPTDAAAGSRNRAP